MSETSIQDPIYDKLVKFLNDSNYIRKGTIEIVRTLELTNAFNSATGEQVTYKHKFPRLMKRFMNNYPNLISKQVKHYGTIYSGIGLITDQPKVKHQPLTSVEKNERRGIRNRQMLDKLKDSICLRSGWSTTQYQQMVDLSIVSVMIDGDTFNVDAMINVIIGRMTEYVYMKNTKLNGAVKYAESVKKDFERCTELDLELLESDGVIYTNRLKAAERTYDP